MPRLTCQRWGGATCTTSGIASQTGPGAFQVGGLHTYADEGSFTISTTLATSSTSGVATGTASVLDADSLTGHAVNFAFSQGNLFSGTVASFTDTDLANVAGDFLVTINWGDGSALDLTSGIVSGSGADSFLVGGVHTFATHGPFTVTTTLLDNSPGTASGMANSTATAVPEPSNAVLLGGALALALAFRRVRESQLVST